MVPKQQIKVRLSGDSLALLRFTAGRYFPAPGVTRRVTGCTVATRLAAYGVPLAPAGWLELPGMANDVVRMKLSPVCAIDFDAALGDDAWGHVLANGRPGAERDSMIASAAGSATRDRRVKLSNEINAHGALEALLADACGVPVIFPREREIYAPVWFDPMIGACAELARDLDPRADMYRGKIAALIHHASVRRMLGAMRRAALDPDFRSAFLTVIEVSEVCNVGSGRRHDAVESVDAWIASTPSKERSLYWRDVTARIGALRAGVVNGCDFVHVREDA